MALRQMLWEPHSGRCGTCHIFFARPNARTVMEMCPTVENPVTGIHDLIVSFRGRFGDAKGSLRGA
jgi:hypothetical protein